MSIEQMFIGLLGAACTCLGWFANQCYQAIKQMQADLNHLEVRIGTDFVRYDRLQDMLKPIASGIEEIKAALGKKVDK